MIVVVIPTVVVSTWCDAFSYSTCTAEKKGFCFPESRESKLYSPFSLGLPGRQR